MPITPVTTPHHPGPSNVYIPPDVSDSLRIQYIRNPASFALKRYARFVPVSTDAGLYPSLDQSLGMRVSTSQDTIWPDGQCRPCVGTQRHTWKKYKTSRHSHGDQLGNKTIRLGSWDLVASHSLAYAQQAMTALTSRAMTVLHTAANYPTSNKAATIDALLSGSGLSWTASSTAEQTIKKSFNAVREAILKRTGVIPGYNGQLKLILTPTIAHQISTTAEVSQYLVNHDYAMSNLGIAQQHVLNTYSLPPIMYGVEIVVEDSVISTGREEVDGTFTGAFQGSANHAVFVFAGDDVGVSATGTAPQTNFAEAPTFTSLTAFEFEALSVEMNVESFDRITKIGVATDYDFQLSAPDSAYLIENITT